MDRTDRRPLRREDRPPSGDLTWIRRIKGTVPYRFIILSCELRGYWGHWDGYKTSACTGDNPEECEGHKRKFPLKWRGYLHVKDVRDGALYFLELPKAAAAQVGAQVADDESLRGLCLEIVRTSNAAQAHYRVKITPRIIPLDKLEGEADPEAHVARLWGCIPRRQNKSSRAGELD